MEYEDLHNFPKIAAFMKECIRVRNPAISNLPRIAVESHYLKDIYIKKSNGFYKS